MTKKIAIALLCTVAIIGCNKTLVEMNDEEHTIPEEHKTSILICRNGYDENRKRINVHLECVCGNCKDEFYWWAGGKKVFFDYALLNNWLFIGFYPQVKPDDVLDFINQAGLFVPFPEEIRKYLWHPTSGLVGYGYYDPRHYYLAYVTLREPATCIELREIVRTLEKSPIVAFVSLTSSFEHMFPRGYFPYIYVTVKDSRDLSDLYAVVKETNTTIIGQHYLKLDPPQFIIRVNKDSKGNTRQLANYFTETGKFELVSALYLGGIIWGNGSITNNGPDNIIHNR